MTETDTHPKRRLNPFAFPPETNVRFNVLIIIAVMFAFNVALFVKPVNDLIQGLEVPEVDLSDPASAHQGINEWRQAFLQSLLILALPSGVVLAVLILGMAIYFRHPVDIRRKKNLQELTRKDDALFIDAVQALVTESGISPTPRIEVDVESRSLDGQAFGFRNRYSLRLGGRLRLLLRKNPGRFNAIILHELAHIANDDVQRTYFAQAFWVAVVIIAFIPAMGIALFSTHLPITLIRLTQFGITLAIVAAIRASLLRVRELYADWQAARWGAESSLSTILQDSSSKNKNRRWARFWQLHPTAPERLDVLQSPVILFQSPTELSFLIGVLLSYFLLGAINLFAVFTMILSSSAAFGYLIVSQNSDGSLLLQSVIFFVISVVTLLLGLSLGIAAVYSVVGSLGTEIQKESVADMVINKRRWKTYLNLWRVGVVMALGFQVGNLTVPSSIIGLLPKLARSAEGALVLLAVALQLIVFAILMWMWLAYIRFLARHTLGRYTGRSSPKREQLLITLISSGVLLAFYVPIMIGNLTIEDIASRVTDVGVSNLDVYLAIIPFVIAGALILYIATFGATWLLVQIRQYFQRLICPSCKQITKKRYAVGEVCEHCGKDLAPWLFVNESPASNSA